MSPALIDRLPGVEGRLRVALPLAPRTWFRAGGSAEAFFAPAGLVRDGGIDGVVVRLSGALAAVRVEGERLVAGAGASDRAVAIKAAEAGIAGLEFLIGIPGTLGGAIRMNAGAFGGETAEIVDEVVALDPDGTRHRLHVDDLGFSYRRAALPEGWIVTEVTLRGRPGEPAAIKDRMRQIKAEREASQPLRVATGGSTFKNPPGARAWELIDAAGCRGLRRGRAMVSEKHCNFLVNLGGASAADLEGLGEEVRARVRAATGTSLDWEIRRLGQGPDRLDAAA
jgi:UDP-N-acetylmuramate dehydrogenase